MTKELDAESEKDLDRDIVFGQRLVRSMFRKEASDRKVNEAVSLARDVKLPRRSIEFVFEENDEFTGWLPAPGLGTAFQTYVDRLREMEVVRRSHRGIGLAYPLGHAFKRVRDAADALSALGWPVNWEQSARSLLEMTEFAIRGRELVEQHENLPDTVTLDERLAVLGTVTFDIRTRGEGGVETTRAMTLTGVNKRVYGPMTLRLDQGSKAFQYSSDWTSSARSKREFQIRV